MAVAVPGRAALKARIEAALRDRFGYDAWIVLVTLDELATALDAFPFDAADGAGPSVFVPSESITIIAGASSSSSPTGAWSTAFSACAPHA